MALINMTIQDFHTSDAQVSDVALGTIMTSDNQEAEIVVAQNIPFIATRASDTTNLSNVFSTVERQDVGITLRITPQISEGGLVRLDIFQEVSALIPSAVTGLPPRPWPSAGRRCPG